MKRRILIPAILFLFFAACFLNPYPPHTFLSAETDQTSCFPSLFFFRASSLRVLLFTLSVIYLFGALYKSSYRWTPSLEIGEFLSGYSPLFFTASLRFPFPSRFGPMSQFHCRSLPNFPEDFPCSGANPLCPRPVHTFSQLFGIPSFLNFSLHAPLLITASDCLSSLSPSFPFPFLNSDGLPKDEAPYRVSTAPFWTSQRNKGYEIELINTMGPLCSPSQLFTTPCPSKKVDRK